MLTVIGEALIDLVADRADPAAFRALPGGSPLNVAIGLARLGRRTAFAGRFSGDAFGQMLRAHAERNGVSLGPSVDAAQPSTLAVATLNDAGAAAYDFYLDGAADWQWSREELRRLPAEATVLHTGSLASWIGPGAGLIAEALRERRRQGRSLISYDPNVRPALLGDPAAARAQIEPYLGIAHVVKASDQDLEWLYPGRDPLDSLRAWAGAGPDLVVLTRGERGCVAITGQGRELARAARPASPLVDSVGAGDAFTAGLLGAICARGLDRDGVVSVGDDVLAAVLDGAGIVASLTCERPGADPPTAVELARAR